MARVYAPVPRVVGLGRFMDAAPSVVETFVLNLAAIGLPDVVRPRPLGVFTSMRGWIVYVYSRGF
jgi:hypothetical protein